MILEEMNNRSTKAHLVLNDMRVLMSFCKHLKPDIVVFDRFISEEQFGWRVAKYAPNALRILDTEDLHSLRTYAANLAFSKGEMTFDTWANWFQNDHDQRERWPVSTAAIFR